MSISSQTLRELAIKVSQYFLDFLESDFKRQQAPRRRIVLQTDAGARAGMKIAPYPALQKALWDQLQKPAGDRPSVRLRPRAFTRPIGAALRGVIREQVQALSPEALAAVREGAVSHVAASRGAALENPERWIDEARLALAALAGEQIVRPLLALLDGPLSSQAYSAQDSIFAAETELVELLVAKADAALPEQLARFLATGEIAPLQAMLEELLTLEDVRAALQDYFETYTAGDAFQEFRDLAAYAATGENLQTYLYLGVLRFGALSFPLFYLPVEVEPTSAGFELSLVGHLYANKRAIDFVLQELAERQAREWLAPITERIVYLGPTRSAEEVAAPLFERIAAALDLGGQLAFAPGAVQEARTASVGLSTALHLAVFDRSDEALLNDYEQMIREARADEAGVVELFESLVQGVLVDNPVTIAPAVDQAWDALPLVERMVIDSPVPLNEEQVRILSAIRNPEGRIVVVEGPPGTGKSHTITAIAADCVLTRRSCLVLSDKTEALDVVQAKLSEAMNQARNAPDFPNPILRLGQDQTNFKRLIANQSLTQISAYVKAARANRPAMEEERERTRAGLQRDIAAVVASLGQLTVGQIAAAQAAEAALAALAPDLPDALRDLCDADLPSRLDVILDPAGGFEDHLRASLSRVGPGGLDALVRRLRIDAATAAFAAPATCEAFAAFERLTPEQLRIVSAALLEFEQLRMPLIGHLFRGGAVRAIERRLNSDLPAREPLLLKAQAPRLKRLLTAADAIRDALPGHELDDGAFVEIYEALARSRLPAPAAAAADALLTALRRTLDPESLAVLHRGEPARVLAVWQALAAWLRRWIPIAAAFRAAPAFDYVGAKRRLEQLEVSAMNAEVDSRLVAFMDNHRADARTLAALIANRQKFPEDKFAAVKDSFPVILASIRQFGEYMPLAPNLFDVVVIDEASQVSVAQAFPALLRAKKVVVLGDSKQFSNTKSANASNALNDKYRSDLQAFFRQRISTEAAMLQRLSHFDVKCSILEFCQLCANHASMLRKHFRSYQELISYSSETFYGGQLQAIKIRGAPLQDVIRFDHVTPDLDRIGAGANEAEADFILERLLDLVEDPDPPSVGVITPHREQQNLLTRKLFGHPRGGEFQSRLRLKVMTFDSCQGEERQIIFYSMVANRRHDALNYIFPVDLADAEEGVEDKLKMQRLNVGFSRAEELVWFVLSKPIGEFRGSIAKALQHYEAILNRGEADPDLTDPSSPMERRVLDWLQQTPFYLAHEDRIEIVPQFPIGDYLRQLDPTYRHPAWRVDFLLTVSTARGRAHIVIEYDGFEHHFARGRPIDASNAERYLNEADVERQLTLESYGYRFLRLNRFNLGRDPVATLSARLEALVERLFEEPDLESVAELQQMATGLVTREMKTCPRCNEVKPQDAFFDQALKGGAGGYGRVCLPCKAAAHAAALQTAAERRRAAWRPRSRWLTDRR